MTLTGEPMVRVHGDVDPDDVTYATAKVQGVLERLTLPVLAVEVKLSHAGDPARQRPCIAEATIDVNGTVLRGHVAADGMREAADLLAARLGHRVDHLLDRVKRPRPAGRPDAPGTGAWRHGDPPTERPEWYDRPAEDRDLVRRKSFAPGPLSPDEAADTMGLLGHRFFLFPNVVSGGDALVWLDGDEVVLVDAGDAADPLGDTVTPMRVVAPPADPASVDVARGWIDAADEPFVFFVDADTGRGSVVYRRYDGHDGLVTLA